MDHIVALARADLLAKSSAEALKRLNRRVESLEKDVLPVHEQTKTLHTAHTNIGLAMTDLSEACSQLRAIVTLQEILESTQLQHDWDRFFACLEEGSQTLAYVKAHSSLSQQVQLVNTVEGVLHLAVDCLQSQYVQTVESIPRTDKGQDQKQVLFDDRGRGSLEKVSHDLVRLRGALLSAGCDVAAELLLDLRTEAATAALLRAQRMLDTRDTQTSGIARIPSQLLQLLLSERILFTLALPNQSSDGEGEEGEEAGRGRGGGGVEQVGSSRGRGTVVDKEGGGGAGSMSLEAQEAFDELCAAVVSVFARIVKEFLASAATELPASTSTAGWGAAAPVARRFDITLDLLELHHELNATLPELHTLLTAVPSNASTAPALTALVPLVTHAAALSLQRLLRAVANAGGSGYGPAPLRMALKGSKKAALQQEKEWHDSSQVSL